MRQKCSKYLCLMVCFLLLMACGSASKKPVIIIDKTIPKAQIVLTEEQKQSYQKALRFMEQKNFADAESIFNKLIKSQPELTGAYVNLGAIKKADNKPDEAGVLYELYLQDYALAVQHYKRYITLSSAEDVETVKRWILLLERK